MGHIADPIVSQPGLVSADQPVDFGCTFENGTRQVGRENPATDRFTDFLCQFLMRPATFAPVIGLESATADESRRGTDQCQQQASKIVDVNDRAGPPRRQRL